MDGMTNRHSLFERCRRYPVVDHLRAIVDRWRTRRDPWVDVRRRFTPEEIAPYTSEWSTDLADDAMLCRFHLVEHAVWIDTSGISIPWRPLLKAITGGVIYMPVAQFGIQQPVVAEMGVFVKELGAESAVIPLGHRVQRTGPGHTGFQFVVPGVA